MISYNVFWLIKLKSSLICDLSNIVLEKFNVWCLRPKSLNSIICTLNVIWFSAVHDHEGDAILQ